MPPTRRVLALRMSGFCSEIRLSGVPVLFCAGIRREAFDVSLQFADIRFEPLFGDREYPLLVQPVRKEIDLESWADANREWIDHRIARHGAILFRGFRIGNAERFERIVDAIVQKEWVEYREAATPRSHVQGNVFTSTEYPEHLRIYVHNENSHVTSWPLYLFFYCHRTADKGGETPLADCREIYRRLPPDILSKFESSGWLYRRNFLRTSAIPWTKAFNTQRREVVEQYCRTNFMSCDWTQHGLSLHYRRWATLQHPHTGDKVWFNHGTFFNIWTLEPELKQVMRSLPDEYVPHNTYYADGTPIPDEVMQVLGDAYAAQTVAFPWRVDDILMVDNMRLAHGRMPYSGARQVLVAMKTLISCDSVAEASQYASPCR